MNQVTRFPAPLTGKGAEKAKELNQRVRPRTNDWDGKRNPQDNGLLFGDSLRVVGPLDGFKGRGLEGKFEVGFLIWLGQVFGNVSRKTGIGNFLTKDITNIHGEVTSVEGSGNGFLTPVDVTYWGDKELINLLLNGYSAEDFQTFAEIPVEEWNKFIIAKAGSFWNLYLLAEKAFKDPKRGGYNEDVKALYDTAKKELERTWKIARQLKLVSNLDQATTASFECPPELEHNFYEKSKEIAEEWKKNGLTNFISGPVEVLKYPNGNVRKIQAKYADLDFRSDEEKNFELPPEPIIRLRTPKEFWDELCLPMSQSEHRRRLGENRKIERKNLRLAAEGKPLHPLLPIKRFRRVPEKPIWRGEELWMVPIVPMEGQEERLLSMPKVKHETDEEYDSRMYRRKCIVKRRYLWKEGFYLSVPIYAKTGEIIPLVTPPRESTPKFTPQEVIELISKNDLKNRKDIETFFENQIPLEPVLSEKAKKELEAEMKPLVERPNKISPVVSTVSPKVVKPSALKALKPKVVKLETHQEKFESPQPDSPTRITPEGNMAEDETRRKSGWWSKFQDIYGPSDPR